MRNRKRAITGASVTEVSQGGTAVSSLGSQRLWNIKQLYLVILERVESIFE